MQESGLTADVVVFGAGAAGLTTSAELQRTGCLEVVFHGERATRRAVEVAC